MFPRRSKKGKKAVSKRAPKKKKTYDSDEESDGYDDDSEDDWGTRRCRNHTFGTVLTRRRRTGAKQKKKAPAPKKAAWTGAEYSHCIPAWTHPSIHAGPEAETSREAGAGSESSAEGQSGG